MNVRTFTPPDALKPFIRSIFSLETGSFGNGQKTFTPVIDGCPGLMIQDTDFGTISREGKALPSSFLFGQSTRPVALSVSGGFNALCVCFHPHALGSLFKLNAETLTDTCMEVSLLSDGYNFASRIQESGTVNGKLEILNGYLFEYFAGSSGSCDLSVGYILDKIMASNGAYPLSKLKQEVHLSERSFERKFKQQVGVSAKLFSRICMFQSSFQQLKNQEFEKLADIAFANTYSDQSHFIRAFREFAGLPPSQYHRKTNLVAENLSERLL